MSYQWPLNPQELFGERYPQMINAPPGQDVDTVRAAITDMWADSPGGWVYEWQLAAACAGRFAPASRSAYGWASSPA
jgi:esterase FrsA